MSRGTTMPRAKLMHETMHHFIFAQVSVANFCMRYIWVSMICVLLMLSGCVFDEAAITASANGMHPSFGLRYVREADVPVGLSEFNVRK